MKSTRSILALSLLFTTCVFARESGQQWWNHELSFNSLPVNQTPPWAARGKGGVSSLEGGALVLSTTEDSQSIAYTLERTPLPDAVTVEFRVRARASLGKFAGHFNLSLDGKVYVIRITNTEPLTYRIVVENGVATLYCEGDSPRVLPGTVDDKSIGVARLLFGDGSSPAQGTTEWSGLRWAWDKAVPSE